MIGCFAMRRFQELSFWLGATGRKTSVVFGYEPVLAMASPLKSKNLA